MSTPHPVTRHTLERYLAAELEGEELARVEAALAADPRLRQQLAALRADEVAFRAEVPYAAFRIEHERRVLARGVSARRWTVWGPALMALAGAAGMLLVTFGGPPSDDGPTRSKGAGVALEVALEEDGRLRAAVTGERVAAGARLQLGYDAGEASYVALLGIDGQGAVSVYFPEDGEQMAPLPAGPRGRFPFSLTLDATPGAEQLVAVFAERPLAIATLTAAARAVAAMPREARPPLALPDGAEQATFWLQKS